MVSAIRNKQRSEIAGMAEDFSLTMRSSPGIQKRRNFDHMQVYLQ
jgi:hypothetical protein